MSSNTDFFQHFFKHKTRLEYEPGERILRGDDIPAGVFFIGSGLVNKYILLEDGSELSVQLLHKYSIFPLTHISNNHDNHYFFNAVEQTTVFKCTIEEFQSFLKKNPVGYMHILESVIDAEEEILTKLISSMKGDAYKQLASSLYVITQNVHTDQTENIEIPFTQEELASQTGIARETVSRMLQEMKDKSIVSYSEGRLLVKSVNKLYSIIDNTKILSDKK